MINQVNEVVQRASIREYVCQTQPNQEDRALEKDRLRSYLAINKGSNSKKFHHKRSTSNLPQSLSHKPRNLEEVQSQFATGQHRTSQQLNRSFYRYDHLEQLVTTPKFDWNKYSNPV